MSEQPPVQSGDEPTQPTGTAPPRPGPAPGSAGDQPAPFGGGWPGPSGPPTGQFPPAPGVPPGMPWWGAWWVPPGGGVPPGGFYGAGPYGAPPPKRRQHPVLAAAMAVAAAALMALGVGIGYIVWGSPTAATGTRSSLPPAHVQPTVPRPGPVGSTTSGSSPKGFLGVEVSVAPASSASAAGAHVVAVVPGSPAAKAGMAAGDTITSFGTRRVVSSITLQFDTQSDAPGTRVSVGWTTATGKHEHATVTLARRPSGGASVG